MIQNSSVPVISKMSLIVLISSIIIPLYWYLGQVINVYKFPWLGAIYEMLWLGMLLGLFVLPVFSFIYWFKSKFSFRSLYFYSFIISLISVLLIVTSK